MFRSLWYSLPLATLSVLAAAGCAPVAQSCEVACSTLCDRMRSCNVGDTSDGCTASCLSSASTVGQCSPDRVKNASCDELTDLVHCAEYCQAVCTRGAECGAVSDATACGLACATEPQTCKLASIAARTCDQIKKETDCYQAMAKAGSGKVVCGHGGGQAGDLCGSAYDCQSGLVCSSTTSTCAPCASDGDCNQPGSIGKKYCRVSDHTCQYASCLSDSDCSSFTTRPHCAPDTYTCSACSQDAHCDSATPLCRGGTCAGCSTDADCPADRRHCTKRFQSDTSKVCMACISDFECQPAETCVSQLGVCRKRCKDQATCGDGECAFFLDQSCTDPVGTPCDENDYAACGDHLNCIHTDANNLTVASYCTRWCTSERICPSGTVCVDAHCRKR